MSFEGELKARRAEHAAALQAASLAQEKTEKIALEKQFLVHKLENALTLSGKGRDEIARLTAELDHLSAAIQRSEARHRAELGEILTLNSLNPLREILAATEKEIRRLGADPSNPQVAKQLSDLNEQRRLLRETIAESGLRAIQKPRPFEAT